MSNFDQGTSLQSDEALEQLLRRASPRPTPSQSDEVAVRKAVLAEWQHVSGRHQSRRRIMHFAVAATVLIGVFSVFSFFRLPVIETVQVASIEKSSGSIYLLGENAVLRETPDLSIVLSGQTIVTGKQAGMALAWGDRGSLRMDENTRVEFTAENSVFLKSGRIYFDSEPSQLTSNVTAGRTQQFVVSTDFGEVAHIGTQFMTGVESDELTVSVREGQVAIDGEYHSRIATSGQQLTFSGRQKPSVLSISRSGSHWDWVSRMSPVTDVDGKTLHEYLLWASRELGLEIKWLGEAEDVARKAILRGTIDKEPAEAMKLRIASAALSWRIDEGVITVGDNQ